MRIRLWGTRGSLPSAGPETVRYGGNTSCVEVRGKNRALLVLDAGTGIRRLGGTVEPEIERVHILLTHLHMDHIQGLGFFEPLYRPGLDVHIYGPRSTTQELRARLTRYLSPPLFPVRLRDLPSHISVHNVPLGRFEVNGFEVTADLVTHPGPTVGYRISDGRSTLVYIPDHEPALGTEAFPPPPEWTSGYDLSRSADLLIHDAQYTDAEYEGRVGWGHSSIRHAVAFAALAGVRRLVAFHHDPGHTDDHLDRLMAEAQDCAAGRFDLVPGIEGATFDL